MRCLQKKELNTDTKKFIMDSFEKQVTSSLLGENYSEFETKAQKRRRIAKQQADYEAQTAGLDMTIPKLQRTVTSPTAPLTKFAEPSPKRDSGSILDKALDAGRKLLDLSSPSNTGVAPVGEPKKILGMQPSTFWMMLGGLTLLTITVVAVTKNKAK